MKIKNIIMLSSALLFASTFNAYSVDLDDVEKEILTKYRPVSGHFDKVSEEESSDNGRPTIKTKFNEGDILKVTFQDPFEVQNNGGPLSLKLAAQVLTTGRKEIILEHLWVNRGIRVAKSYLVGTTPSEEEGTQWSLSYFSTDFTAATSFGPQTVEAFLNLVIAHQTKDSVCGPLGTKCYNLDIKTPREHLDYLSFSNLSKESGVKFSASSPTLQYVKL